MTKQPSYRFADYTEPWEERKFGQLIRSIQTGTTLLGNEQNNGIPLLKMGNIQRGYWDLAKIERLEQEIESENIIRYGDFIFNTRNTLELVGKGATWILKNGIYGFNSNLARVIFDGIDTIFFNYLYNIPNSISQVKARAVGTTSVAAVYPRDLYSINFSLPSLSEQTAIGSFFQDIDQLISLQQRKLEVLKEQRKTYLKLLFPAKGQTTPTLRFAGFEDEWKEVKLGEVLKKNNKKNRDLAINNVESVSNKLGFVKQTEQFEDYSVASADLSNYYVISEKQFAYNPSRINVGSIAYKKEGDTLSVVSPLYISFSTVENIDDSYLWYWFKTSLFDSQRAIYSEGGVRDTLSFNQLSDIELTFPSLPEQEAIGSFFQDLDKTIAKQEEKVNQLKESKQTLLRKMFI